MQASKYTHDPIMGSVFYVALQIRAGAVKEEQEFQVFSSHETFELDKVRTSE